VRKISNGTLLTSRLHEFYKRNAHFYNTLFFLTFSPFLDKKEPLHQVIHYGLIRGNPLKPIKQKKIVIVSSNAPDGKRYHISGSLMLLLLFLAGILLLAAAGGILYAISLAKTSMRQKTEIERLQEENQEQQFQIQGFASKMSFLNDQMERLENFHTKFKILAQKDLKGKGNALIDRDLTIPETVSSSIFPGNDLKQQIEGMYLELDELKTRSLHREKSMYEMENFLDHPQTLLGHHQHPPLPSLLTTWPTFGSVMSGFGRRLSPFTGRLQMHNGIDIASSIGTPVRATADGVVLYRGWEGDYGNTIILDHGHGYVSKYAHLSHIHVKNGEYVHRGDIIGSVGHTGATTGPHLHFEVKVNGIPVNPKRYLHE
jgi:murein DD-endopeptidase MepM/ murein hydrolase activator NlpD